LLFVGLGLVVCHRTWCVTVPSVSLWLLSPWQSITVPSVSPCLVCHCAYCATVPIYHRAFCHSTYCVTVPGVSPCLVCHCAYCHRANLPPCLVCHCAYCVTVPGVLPCIVCHCAALCTAHCTVTVWPWHSKLWRRAVMFWCTHNTAL